MYLATSPQQQPLEEREMGSGCISRAILRSSGGIEINLKGEMLGLKEGTPD